MKTSLDKSGRVVIPKKLRERANLDPGVEFEIEIKGKEIILIPIGEEPILLNKDGVLITQGEIIGDAKSIKDIRRERLTQFLISPTRDN